MIRIIQYEANNNNENVMLHNKLKDVEDNKDTIQVLNIHSIAIGMGVSRIRG